MGRETRDGPSVFVPRLLDERGKDESKPRPLSDHFDDAVIVVLGDPGEGKTELFKQMAREEDGRYIYARQFRRRPTEELLNQTLYVDALDEVRAQTGDGHSVLDQIIEKLLDLGKPKLRLSCPLCANVRETLSDLEIREEGDGENR